MVSTKVPIKVQKRSGFDKSHHNALSQKIGTITPILVDEVIPNTKSYLRYAFAGSLPPLAVDAYMKCYYDIRAFFVPFRLLAGGFESWFTNYDYPVVKKLAGANNPNYIDSDKGALPYFTIDNTADVTGIFGHGTLSDYLGFKIDPAQVGAADSDIVMSAMPYLAYHRVCSDWFRQPNIEKEYFARPSFGTTSAQVTGSNEYFCALSPFASPSYAYCNIPLAGGQDITNPNLKLADGTSIFSLRQCNYDYDYFTNAFANAQHGAPMSVNTTGNSFTIQQLRSMNALQQFAELNNLAGANLVDAVYARYGANLSRGVAQRCIYLGGARLDVGTKSVETTASNSGGTANPFAKYLAGTGGRAYVQGTDIIIDDFVANEPGYIFVAGMVVPKVTYGTGIRRYLTHYINQGSITDMANPLLQNVGNQPIYDFELTGSLGFSSDQFNIFGYTDRYAEFMTMEDEVHSQLAYGGTLSAFVAQRVFFAGDLPVISSSFLKVPTGAIDNVAAVTGQLSSYGLYGQFAFEYKVSQPLAQYSMPSLQNPAYEHGQTVMVHRGGFRF